MKQYSEQKFMELDDLRKAKVILDLVYQTEAVWGSLDKKNSYLEQIKQYFTWSESCTTDLKRLLHLNSQISSEMSLRQLLNISVPLERLPNISIKDSDQIKVLHKWLSH